jgi:hypothetical protein
MMAIQLDFFKTEEESEIEAMHKKIQEVKLSNDKVRKKLFAENGKLVKEIMDLKSRLEILERNICHPQKLSQS